MRVFAAHLEARGLRSPQYYQDKSQCLSLHENCPAHEMAYEKALSLQRGYIEPEELIDRLRKLKPSDNFILRKPRYAPWPWDKSPIRGTPYLELPPTSDWFFLQTSDIGRMKPQIGEEDSRLYRQEAQGHWDKVRNVKLTPFPDLHLLKDMGRSPSGTLFPRYLAKGLRKLRGTADHWGVQYYIEEYDKVKVKRAELIHQWKDEHPHSILADDPISIYRTWPTELMDQLDAADQEGIQRAWALYMADLAETEKRMQLLLTFWRDCGLITGQRTPPSPQWPDPMSKLRGLEWPQYVADRLLALSAGYHEHESWAKFKTNQYIEITRWKEAILNASSEPSASDTPFPQSLMDELAVVWQEDRKFPPDEIEDDMITKIAQWRESKRSNFGPEPLQGPSLNGSPERMTEKTQGPNSTRASFRSKDTPSKRPRLPCSDLKKDTQPTAQRSIWAGRLRPRQNAPKSTRIPMDMPQGTVKRGAKGLTRGTQPPATKGFIDKPRGLDRVSKAAGPQKVPDSNSTNMIPVGSQPRRRSQRLKHQAYLFSTSQPQGVQKSRRSRRTTHNTEWQSDDRQSRKLLHLLTLPEFN
ncbi:MAG: hypothetical protein FRX48_02715 [Lasallia pustulata]|uniref:Uncharacterized protein n=1 Tax=Lasallia pustulata TaxID=136370 RepID=A0A5M8PTS8_9LECA|nr:MAG: hypothetical protein FRX48_02715 [Lasallia pustulata]